MGRGQRVPHVPKLAGAAGFALGCLISFALIRTLSSALACRVSTTK
jgi:hypothetical protein